MDLQDFQRIFGKKEPKVLIVDDDAMTADAAWLRGAQPYRRVAAQPRAADSCGHDPGASRGLLPRGRGSQGHGQRSRRLRPRGDIEFHRPGPRKP